MICAVHAVVGATVGTLSGSRGGAFASGVATHLLGDLLRHKDLDPKVEAPLLAATLGLLAWRCGLTSPAVAGAVGAVLPDVENAAWMTGISRKPRCAFPTHVEDGKHHGPKAASAWPQGVLAAACLALVLSRAAPIVTTIKPGVVELLARLDTLVFDVDGVLLDVRDSIRSVNVLAVPTYCERCPVGMHPTIFLLRMTSNASSRPAASMTIGT
jgi:hypothetical protein